MRLMPSLLLSVVACGGVADAPAVDGGVDAEAPVDADVVDAAATPWIGDVLDCGRPAAAGGLAPGVELQRVDLDPVAFPEARCNDGTRAFFYVRPAATAAARNRWVIQLQGGGGCGSPDACAARWCSVDTNFGMTQMTATLSPAMGIGGDGVMARGGALGEPNPLGDGNQVFIRYCSSDGWGGTAGAVDVDGHHPISGAPVRFRIAFAGARILDAVLATMRRDGAAPPPYTLGGGSVELPDLDDADAVVLAGASAGGTGVIHNADRVRDYLRAHNTACTGATCPLAYLAIIDSIFKPDLAALDWSTSTVCAATGACTYEAAMTADTGALQGRQPDVSCATWHAANDPSTAWRCNDEGHVVRDHLTSPFVVRMGLKDDLISSNLIDAMFTVPGRGLMSLALFAELVRADLLALPASTPEEPFARTPAVFGPPCDKHETLSNNAATFGVTVVAAGSPRTFGAVIAAFATGGAPTTAVWGPGDPVDCM
ncbi:MAG: hypothetical protein IPL61_11825 [Myxococcales bacterium]|nr:hypothetical protein [Myxococcales bacterium]